MPYVAADLLAYVDPGTGSLVLQAVVASTLAALVFARSAPRIAFEYLRDRLFPRSTS